MTAGLIWNIVGLCFAAIILAWYGRLTLLTWREERRHSDGGGQGKTHGNSALLDGGVATSSGSTSSKLVINRLMDAASDES